MTSSKSTSAVSPQVALPSFRQLIAGSGIAAAVACIAAVFFILPAEMGIDVTGFGEKTGLTGLAQSASGENIYLHRGLKRTNVLFPLAPTAPLDEASLRRTLAGKNMPVPGGTKLHTDHWEYELQPYENIEMKYRLAQGQPLIFRWRTTAPVHYDQHSVPDEGGNPATESFSISDATAQTAVYRAPFTGIHGWFWQNQNLQPVRVSIDAIGGFTGAVIFDAAGEHPREVGSRP